MVLNNGISYTNYFQKYIIENGKIKESHNGKLNKPQIYNGKIDSSNAEYFFMKFIAINPESESDILTFYNTYGELGTWYNNGTNSEELATAQFEIRVMKILINLKNALDENDMYSIIKVCSELYNMKSFNNNENNIHCSFNDLMYCAGVSDQDVHFFTASLSAYMELNHKNKDSITIESIANTTIEVLQKSLPYSKINDEYIEIHNEIIVERERINTLSLVSGKLFNLLVNSYMKSITPILEYNNCTQECYGQWSCPTLLAAMYFELYLAYCNKKIIRKCKNKTCNKYFPIYGTDKRKEYCDNNCAKLEWQRQNREIARLKKKKYVDENFVDSINADNIKM